MADAKIYNKGGTEKVLIPNVRTAYIHPFEATNWLDLRVGFFLSVCGDDPATEDDVITGLGPETLGEEDTDRYYIGLIHNASRRIFCGYTNVDDGSGGDSKLVSSDAGLGTSNTNFWRPTNDTSNNQVLMMRDNAIIRAVGDSTSQPHFVQNTGGAGGYCTLLMLRFTRDNAAGRAKFITMRVKKDAAFNSDILFSSTPTTAIIEDNLEDFPTTVATLGPVQLSNVPDAFYFYWPFHDSRLRIHSIGVLRQT